MARTNGARKRTEIRKSTHRERELEWMRTHADEMRPLARQWIVLEGETLIAHGKNAVRVVASARRKGIAVPFVFYVEPRDVELARDRRDLEVINRRAKRLNDEAEDVLSNQAIP